MTLTKLIAIGARLREARLLRGSSLEEIAVALNVNRKFLDQIEQGIAPGLPEPYVRGIISLYARRIGVNLEEIPEPAVPERGGAEPPPAHPASHPLTRPPVPATHTADRGSQENQEGEKLRGYQRTIIAGFAFLTIVSLGISIFWMSRENNAKPVQELSFPEAVKEQEAKYAAQLHRTDSASNTGDAAVQLARGDSLLLEGRTIDSVLVTIAIDHAMPRQFMLPPQFRTQWRAEKSFLVTISNPAAVMLTLNGVRLASLSRPNKQVKNVFLSRTTIEKLQSKHD